MSDYDPDLLKQLKDIVAAHAPGLAALLDGSSASVAVSALGKALVGDAQAALADIVAAAKQGGGALSLVGAEQNAQMRLRQGGAGTLADLAAPDAGGQPGAAGAQAAAAPPAPQAPSGGNQAQPAGTPASPGGITAAATTTSGPVTQTELHDKTAKHLAYGVSIGFFLLVGGLLVVAGFKVQIDGGAKDLLFTLLGVVATAWANIIGYYFGSSAGSAQKSKTISDTLIQLQNPQGGQGAQGGQGTQGGQGN